MRFYIFTFILFSICTLQAQQHSKSIDVSTFNHLKRSLNSESRIVSYEKAQKEYSDILGHPLLFKKMNMGYLLDIEGNSSPEVLLNYDMYYDEIYSLVNGKLILLDKTFYSGFTTVGDQKENPILFEHFAQFDGNSYVEVLFKSEELTFVKEIQIKVRNSSKHVAGVDFEERRFIRSYKYFLLDKDGFSHQVKTRKKSIYKKLPNKLKIKWKYLIKKKRLKVKTQEDVVFILDMIVNKKS